MHGIPFSRGALPCRQRPCRPIRTLWHGWSYGSQWHWQIHTALWHRTHIHPWPHLTTRSLGHSLSSWRHLHRTHPRHHPRRRRRTMSTTKQSEWMFPRSARSHQSSQHHLHDHSIPWWQPRHLLCQPRLVSLRLARRLPHRHPLRPWRWSGNDGGEEMILSYHKKSRYLDSIDIQDTYFCTYAL